MPAPEGDEFQAIVPVENSPTGEDEVEPAEVKSAFDLYCAQVAVRPCKMCSCHSVLGIILVAITWHPVTFETNFEPFIQADGTAKRRLDAFNLAIDAKRDYIVDDNSTAPSANANTVFEWSIVKDIVFFYESALEGGDVLDRDIQRQVRDFEGRMRNLEGWRRMCGTMVRPSDRFFCDPGESFVGFAWPSLGLGNGADADTSHTPPTWPPLSISHTHIRYIFDGRGQTRLSASTAIAFLRASSEFSHDIHRYFPLSYSVAGAPWEQPEGAPTAMRSIFQFRLYGNATSGEAANNQRLEADNAFKHFVEREVYTLLEEAQEDDEENEIFQHVRISFYGSDLERIDEWNHVIDGLNWFWGSFLFVTAYMWWHTCSLFLTFSELFIVIFSIALGYTLTPATKTSLVALVSFFIMLGIGSDFLFVYHDYWRQSEDEVGSRNYDRLRNTLPRATRGCLKVAFTIMVCFLTTLASELQPVREFGLFMAICVMACFVLSALLLPNFMVFQTGCCGSHSRRIQDEAGRKRRDMTVSQKIIIKLSASIARCPLVMVGVTAFLCIVFIAGVSSTARLDTVSPELFRQEHNQVRFKRLQDEFSGPFQHQSPPPLEGKACAADHWPAANNQEDDCSLSWCEASLAAVFDVDTGYCWHAPPSSRNASMSQSCAQALSPQGGVPEASTVIVRTRMVSPEAPDLEAWKQVWGDTLGTRMGLTDVNDANTFVTQLRGPVILEDWELGEEQAQGFFDLGGMLFTSDASAPLSGADCEVNVLCFVGTPSCNLQGWHEMGNFSFVPPVTTLTMTTSSAGDVSTTVPQVDFTGRTNVSVRIVWGVLPAKTKPLLGDSEEPWVFDPTFKPTNPWAQRALLNMCSGFPEQLYVVNSDCWIVHFKDWLQAQGKPFPSREFNEDVVMWWAGPGTEYVNEHVWLRDNQVQALYIDITGTAWAGDNGKPTSKDVIEYMHRWEDYVYYEAADASVFAHRPFQTSVSWPRAEGEIAVVKSTALFIGLAVVCGFAALCCCMWDPILTIITLMMTLVSVLGVTFYIVTIEGWAIGAIELVSLIISMGFAFTYSSQVALLYQAPLGDEDFSVMQDRRYVDQDEAGQDQEGGLALDQLTESEFRILRSRVAMFRICRPILGSTVVTVGSSFFFLFGTMTVFVKVAALLIVEALLSLFVALFCLPAILMLVGPAVEPWYLRHVKRMTDSILHPSDQRSSVEKRGKRGTGHPDAKAAKAIRNRLSGDVPAPDDEGEEQDSPGAASSSDQQPQGRQPKSR